MPIVEVDSAELETARAAQRLLVTLENDPRTRSKIFEALKTFNPEAKLPVSFIEAQETQARLAEIAAKADEKTSNVTNQMAEFLATQRAIGERDRAHASLRKKGWDDAGIEKIETLMTRKGIVDYDDAAVLYEKSLPPPEQANPSGLGYNKGWDLTTPRNESDNSKFLWGDPKDRAGLAKKHQQFVAAEVNAWKAEQAQGTR